MNPDETIRPWLLGCGGPFGAYEAHPYRWPDPSTRPEVPYFTYRPVKGLPDVQNSQMQKHELVAGTHDANSDYWQHWTISYQIDLYNSESGLVDLAGCAIGAAREQSYLNLFYQNNAGFAGVDSVEDLTEEDDERVYYHHRMICRFTTWVIYKHFNANHVIDEVILDNPFGVD